MPYRLKWAMNSISGWDGESCALERLGAKLNRMRSVGRARPLRTDMTDSNPRKFEDELADLEGIVSQIDSGELSLEESIAAFERGVALVRSLNQKLDEVER